MWCVMETQMLWLALKSRLCAHMAKNSVYCMHCLRFLFLRLMLDTLLGFMPVAFLRSSLCDATS